jgi:hypothetical protein
VAGLCSNTGNRYCTRRTVPHGHNQETPHPPLWFNSRRRADSSRICFSLVDSSTATKKMRRILVSSQRVHHDDIHAYTDAKSASKRWLSSSNTAKLNHQPVKAKRRRIYKSLLNLQQQSGYYTCKAKCFSAITGNHSVLAKNTRTLPLR